MSEVQSPRLLYCSECGNPVAPVELTCPHCGHFVHHKQIEELRERASQKLSAGDAQGARDALVELLPLIPEDSELHAGVLERVQVLSKQIAAGVHKPVDHEKQKSNLAKKLGPFGALAALLLKFKSLGLLFLAKGKLIFLALTNLKALFGIFAFLGLYWALYGWQFAVGFFVSIFIHEMGHYIVVKRYGFAAELPVFLPGLGAYVRWHGANVDPVIRARISLAGPLFGLFASALAFTLFQATHSGVWLAVAQVGAWINLLNLLPVSIFDGGSAMNALGKQERIAVLVVCVVMLWIVEEHLVYLLIAAGTIYRIVKKDYPERPSQSTGLQFVGLLVVLGLMSWYFTQLFHTQVHQIR